MIIKEHVKKWNEWRKHNCNSKLHKMLALFKIVPSPTFMLFVTEEELKRIREKLDKEEGKFLQ